MVFVNKLISQPSVLFALQFANPELHTIEQTPEIQTGAELGRVGQTVVQLPHLLVLVNTFTSQPSDVIPLQSVKPELQAIILHAPFIHPTIALGKLGQAIPQAPQLFTFVFKLISQPSAIFALQLPKLGLQTSEHNPETQTEVALATGAHTNPHDPQLFTLFNKFNSQPSVRFELQLPKLGLQIIKQIPDKHVGEELGLTGHIVPQVPQLFALESRLISQPSNDKLLQFANPLLHTKEHNPEKHAGVEFANGGQTFPQDPQLLGSESTGAPLSINASQLSSIALHNSEIDGLILALLSLQSELFKTYPAG